MHKRFKVEDYMSVGVDFNTKNTKGKTTQRTQREIPAVFLKRKEALAWLMPESADKADLCVLNS
jgi:hypothetical protein